MKRTKQGLSFLILCSIAANTYAGGYEPFMGNAKCVRPHQRYFEQTFFGINYTFYCTDMHEKVSNVFSPATTPLVKRSKEPALESLDVYIGYGQQLSDYFYLGARLGAQLYTKSETEFRTQTPIPTKNEFKAQNSGFLDILPGAIINDRLMLYPFLGFSNTKYVYEGFQLTPTQSVKFRDEAKWGTAMRFGAGAKYAFLPNASMDIHYTHNAGGNITWPAIGNQIVNGVPQDQNKTRFKPSSNTFSVGFEGYIN